jgi:hypothetical protein
VLRPIIEEVGDKSPLKAALVAPESTIKVTSKLVGVSYAPANDIEFCVREVENEVYLLACNRGNDTLAVTFEGLPQTQEMAEVMFESPRKVKIDWVTRQVDRPKKAQVQIGMLTDWFAPYDVHVYKLTRK